MSLPDWLEPLPGAAEQRALDEWAIGERGIPGLDLMERAGEGLTNLVCELAPTGTIAVVCGKGNNGGDGLVAARLLRVLGRDVRVLLLAAPEELRGDAKTNCERLPGAPPERFDPGGLEGAGAIVDAILGTGFSGEPRDPASTAIAAINAAADAGAVVVACDVPSGVDGSTGEIAGEAVRAGATATFHAAKPGLWIAPGKVHAGEVRVIDIGIPPGGPLRADVGLIEDRVTGLIPTRGSESTKFAAGSVLVCGGSLGLTGAPSMASESAMRAGRGLRDRARARVAEPRVRDAAARGDVRAPARCRRVAAGRRGGNRARARWPGRCARARPRPGARAGGAGAGPQRGRGRRAAVAARRRRPQRPCRQAGVAGPAQRADGPDPARRRARPAAGLRQRRDRRQAVGQRPAGSRSVGRDRGPEGRRHARRRAVRAGRRQPRGRPGAGDGGHRRRPLGRDRGVPGEGHGAVCGGLRGSARARDRRTHMCERDRRGGRDRLRRDRGASPRALRHARAE